MSHYRQAVHTLTELATQTDKGICWQAPSSSTCGGSRSFCLLSTPSSGRAPRRSPAPTGASTTPWPNRIGRTTHRRRLDDLLKRRDNGKTTWLAWLRQSPVKPNSRHMLEHIERLKAWQALDLPSGIERSVHQNRLLKIAREVAR